MKNPHYTNKFVFNQRGASIDIRNSTDREEIKISQYSGSNITINNIVNSELATNNKQLDVIYDSFTTVGNTNSTFVIKDNDVRVGENSYAIKGALSGTQIIAINEWVQAYKPIADDNSRFDIQRGGKSYPGEITLPQSGTRTTNPDLQQQPLIVNNTFGGYSRTPLVDSKRSEVSEYVPIVNRRTSAAVATPPTPDDLNTAFNIGLGTEAPGIIKYGPDLSSATQDGTWDPDPVRANIGNSVVGLQAALAQIERRMGNGGDDIEDIKRNRVVNVGAAVNTYPSVRVDLEGKSTNTEVGVGKTGTFIHRDFVPVVEEVDNFSSFPCGNSMYTIGNRHHVTVGSGGVAYKTTGPITLAGTSVKLIGTQSIVSGAAGVSIMSEKHIDMISDKIHLRSPRQVYVDTSLGVASNLVVAGGAFVEGELYVNHITCPLEVQETRATGVFATAIRNLPIGYVDVFGERLTVFGSGTPDTIRVADHTHHFFNVPLTVKNSHEDVRVDAHTNNINKTKIKAVATRVIHESKVPN